MLLGAMAVARGRVGKARKAKQNTVFARVKSNQFYPHVLKKSFHLDPVSPPVYFEGAKIRNLFFLDGRFCEQHLSEWGVL